MTFGFNDAFAELLPFHMPEIFSWKKEASRSSRCRAGTSRAANISSRCRLHKAPLPDGMNFRTVFANPPNNQDEVSGYTFAFQLGQYLALRGDSRVYDWQTLNANAKYFNDVRRTAMTNWENKEMDIRTNAIAHTMKRRDTLRMAMTKVLYQNKIDMFVNPVNLTLQGKIGGASERMGGGGGGGRLRVWRDARHSRGVRARGLRGQYLRSRVRARQGRQELRSQGKRDTHEARRHWLAIQPRLLGRAGPGSDSAEGGGRVRGGEPSPCAATRIRPGEGRGGGEKGDDHLSLNAACTERGDPVAALLV
jgi:hypothetical protein